MNNKDIATKLARAIFEAPASADSRHPVRRIQFKGGQQNAETDLGGFCEGALADHISDALDGMSVDVCQDHELPCDQNGDCVIERETSEDAT